MTPYKAMAWRTDETLGFEYWKAAEFTCGQGTAHSIIIVFDSQKERDEYLAKLKDEQVKLALVNA